MYVYIAFFNFYTQIARLHTINKYKVICDKIMATELHEKKQDLKPKHRKQNHKAVLKY